DFPSDQYFWLIRNFRRRSWLLMLLFGASPALDASFVAGMKHDLRRFDPRTWYGEHATSLRMGDLGYHNNAQASLNICFNELESYSRTLERAIHTNWPAYEAIGTRRGNDFIQLNTSVLQIENEYYSAVRPKRTTQPGEKPIQALDARGVEYVEVRCLDLDPFSPTGVTREQIDFLDVFLLDCLLSDSPIISDEECERLDDNYNDVIASGRWQDLKLCRAGEHVPAGTAAHDLLQQLQPLAELLDSWEDGEHYQSALRAQSDKLQGQEWSVPSAKVLEAMTASGMGHRDWVQSISREHQQTLVNETLSPQVLADYQAMTRDSLAEQEAIEAADDKPFARFLEDYLKA
ncbi:MAG: glutamate--cysteine ligase, partial [Marinobacter sp.]